jgi:proteic killer suppression protein/toxin YoeB
MKILFEDNDKKARKVFSDFSLMKKTVGLERTRQIIKRYNQLRAMPNFLEYLNSGLGKPHPLTGDMDGLYAVSITGNIRLIIKPDSDDMSASALKNCDEIFVKGVVDYHGTKVEWVIP